MGLENNFRNSHVSQAQNNIGQQSQMIQSQTHNISANNDLTSSKAPSARFEDLRKSNVSNAIPPVLAEAICTNISKSNISHRIGLEGTPRGSLAGSNIMNSTYVPQPHIETNGMRQSQITQNNMMMNQNDLRVSNVIDHALAGSVVKSIDQAERSLRQSHIHQMGPSTNQIISNSQRLQGSQHQGSRISEVSNRAYNTIITPASEIISNSRHSSMNPGTGIGYQFIQPIV